MYEKEHKKYKKAFNKLLAKNPTPHPFCLESSRELMTLLQYAVSSYRDYKEHSGAFKDLSEGFKETVEFYYGEQWSHMTFNMPDVEDSTLICKSSLSEAALHQYRLEKNLKRNLIKLLRVILSCPEATQMDIFGVLPNVPIDEIDNYIQDSITIFDKMPRKEPPISTYSVFLDAMNQALVCDSSSVSNPSQQGHPNNSDIEIDVPLELLPKFNVTDAIAATKVLGDFERDFLRTTNKDDIENSLMQLATSLTQSPDLTEKHLKTYKLAEIAIRKIFARMRSDIEKGEELSEGIIFVYKYIHDYISVRALNQKNSFFTLVTNIRKAADCRAEINPPDRDLDLFRRILGCSADTVYNFVFSEDLDTFEAELKNIKRNYYSDRLKIFPFTVVQLTYISLFDMYNSLKTGKPLTAVQKAKCNLLESLLYMAIPEDIDEIFENSENFLESLPVGE